MSNQDHWHRITVRVPPELVDVLKAAAAKSARSLNGEIIHRLEESFGPGHRIPEPPSKDEVEELLNAVQTALARIRAERATG